MNEIIIDLELNTVLPWTRLMNKSPININLVFWFWLAFEWLLLRNNYFLLIVKLLDSKWPLFFSIVYIDADRASSRTATIISYKELVLTVLSFIRWTSFRFRLCLTDSALCAAYRAINKRLINANFIHMWLQCQRVQGFFVEGFQVSLDHTTCLKQSSIFIHTSRYSFIV